VSYGRILGADDVHDAMLAHLKAWTPAYIAEVARQAGLAPDALPAFRDWDVLPEASARAEHRLPSCVVTSQGMDEALEDGDGVMSGRWMVTASAYASARTSVETQRLVARYAKAIRAAVMQHRSLGGFAYDVACVGEGYADEPLDSERPDHGVLGGASVVFAIRVDAITKTFAGPLEPPADPLTVPADDPQATVFIVDEQPQE
jgi:hypothetical protein